MIIGIKSLLFPSCFNMLEEVFIQNFRNLQEVKLSCLDNLHIFIGDNGQGKTNLLEAIYTFSIARPFRLKNCYEAIFFEQEAFHIKAKTNSKFLEIHSANFPRRQTKYLVDNKKITSSKFIGSFYAVLFAPEDLLLIKGAPLLRRSFLNDLLVRVDTIYAECLYEYEKILKQRNALLKQIQKNEAKETDLEVWDLPLEKNAQIIWQKRESLLEKIEKEIQKNYFNISQQQKRITLKFCKKIDSNNFLDDLKKRWKKDVLLGTTTVGPHRDDFMISLNSHNANSYASQGEVRSLVLSLKLAEITVLEKKIQDNVTLLLDDVFSELDENRQQSLLALISSRQTFITTTSAHNFKIKGSFFQIQQGRII